MLQRAVIGEHFMSPMSSPTYLFMSTFSPLQTMAAHLNTNAQLQEQITSTDDRIRMLENLNQQLKGTVKAKEQESTQASSSLSQLREQLRYVKGGIVTTFQGWR
jgi:hypothetical protein